MFIKKIIEEGASSKDKDDVVTECTKLVEVKHAIERLNGVEKTTVILKQNENNLMIISGGGENKKYVVFAKVNGKGYFMTNNFSTKKDFVNIVVAKQKQKYPSRRVFNLEMVLESAKHFAHRGSLVQTFNWERG